MTHYDRDCFCIRIDKTGERECSICGDDLSPADYRVVGGNDAPLCDLCAWDKASGLANLLALNDELERFYRGIPPAAVQEAIKQRGSDPKRLQKELEEARDVLGRRNGSILAELVTHEIEAALKMDDVPTRQNALKAFREMDISPYANLDAEIPF